MRSLKTILKMLSVFSHWNNWLHSQLVDGENLIDPTKWFFINEASIKNDWTLLGMVVEWKPIILRYSVQQLSELSILDVQIGVQRRPKIFRVMKYPEIQNFRYT